jgi:serine phosphatase RsbU (regulator of sigma subunit)
MKRDTAMQGWTIYNKRPQLVRAVYLAALVIAVAFSTIWMYRFASVTTDENLYTDIDGKVTIIEIVDGGVSDLAGLRLGDVIVAVNGTPVKDRYEANEYLVRGRGGEVLEYRIERDGKTLDIRVVTADYGLPIFYIALAVTALVFFSTGSYVLLKRPQYPIARLFGWSHLAAGTVLLISKDISFMHYPDAITTIGLFLPRVLWPVTISAFMHLFLFFPVPRFVKPLPQTTYILLYVLPFAAMFIAIVIFLTTLSKSPWGFYLFLVMGATITGIQVYLARSMKNYQSVDYRPRSRWTIWATALSVLFIGGISTFTSFGAWQIIFLSGVAIPGLLFATVIRQRIFDLYVVVRKGSMYTGLSIAFTAFVLLLFLLALLIIPAQDLNVPVLNITSEHIEIIRLDLLDAEQRAVFERRLFFMVGIVLFTGFWWLYKRGRHMLDHRFYRGSLDYKSALSTFSKLSHSYLDRLTLAETVVHDLVSLMRLKSAVFLSREGDSLRPLADNRLSAGSESLILRRDDIATLAPYFEKGHCVAADNLPLRERFAHAGVEFLTAIRTNGEIDALLMLGEKQSETNYSKEDIELLDNLATNVADALLTMRFYEGAREKERLRKELEIARRIQLSSLPSEIPELPGIDIAAHSMPAHEVGGDFYDFLPRYDSTTFIIGDVSGKGTSAAMYLARIQGIVKTIESYQPSLWELLVRLNTQIFDHIEKKSYLTMAGLRVDLLKNEVSYLRAGHLPLVHYNALNREVTLHQPRGMGIGLDRHMFAEQLEEEKIFVRGGDILLLLSDGITEAVNEEGKQFDFEGATASIAENAGGSAQQILEELFAAVGRFSGSAERHDDATAVVIKFSIPRSSQAVSA